MTGCQPRSVAPEAARHERSSLLPTCRASKATVGVAARTAGRRRTIGGDRTGRSELATNAGESFVPLLLDSLKGGFNCASTRSQVGRRLPGPHHDPVRAEVAGVPIEPAGEAWR